MLKTSFENETLVLSGPIDENSQFPSLDLPKNITVNCSGVSGINSVGVKHWINYFTELYSKGVMVEFISCPPCIVEQSNLISNFLAGHTLKQIMTPFICMECDHEQLIEMSVEQIKECSLNPPDVPCTECSSTAEFDELPEEYFYFIKRKSA